MPVLEIGVCLLTHKQNIQERIPRPERVSRFLKARMRFIIHDL